MTRQEYLVNKGLEIDGIIGPDEEIDADFVAAVHVLAESVTRAFDIFSMLYVDNSENYS